jgi:hypothetical protein
MIYAHIICKKKQDTTTRAQISSKEKRPEQSSHESEHDQYLICEKKQDPNTEHNVFRGEEKRSKKT